VCEVQAMAPTPFSTGDDKWPLLAVLTWIAARSLKFAEAFAGRDDADKQLALARRGGSMPPGVNLSDAFRELCQKIEAKEIHGKSAKLKWVVPQEQEHFDPIEYSSLAQPPERLEGCDFRPQELLNSNRVDNPPPLQWTDFVFHDGDCLTPKGSGYGWPNADGSRTRRSWRGVTFRRGDILRLWPDLPCVAAWNKAKAQAWHPPKDLSADWVNSLSPGQYVALSDVMDLLAFGRDRLPLKFNAIEEMAARFRAGRALAEAARSGKVTLCGYSASRVPHYPGGVRRGSHREIDAESCADLTPVIDGERDWLGPTRFADEYAECGQSAESVAFVGVMVHRESLRRSLADLAGKPAPRRGPKPKFDWPVIEAEAARLIDRHGEFSPDNAEWDAQARLEDKLLSFCSERYDREPGRTQLRKRVGEVLTRWRSKKR
jgi:hypothetical protein